RSGQAAGAIAPTPHKVQYAIHESPAPAETAALIPAAVPSAARAAQMKSGTRYIPDESPEPSRTDFSPADHPPPPNKSPPASNKDPDIAAALISTFSITQSPLHPTPPTPVPPPPPSPAALPPARSATPSHTPPPPPHIVPKAGAHAQGKSAPPDRLADDPTTSKVE